MRNHHQITHKLERESLKFFSRNIRSHKELMGEFYSSSKAELDEYNQQFNTISIPRREKVQPMTEKKPNPDDNSDGIFQQTALNTLPSPDKSTKRLMAINSNMARSYESLNNGSRMERRSYMDSQQTNYKKLLQLEEQNTKSLERNINTKLATAKTKSSIHLLESSLKAKRFNDAVSDVKLRNTDRLVDNMDPNHLKVIDVYVHKQMKSQK